MLTKCIIILPSFLFGAVICMVTMRLSLSLSDGLSLGHENSRAESVTSDMDDQAAVVAFEAFETRVRSSSKAAET